MLSFFLMIPFIVRAGEPYTNGLILADGSHVYGNASWCDSCRISLITSNGVKGFRPDELDSSSLIEIMVHFATPMSKELFGEGTNVLVIRTGTLSYDVAIKADRIEPSSNWCMWSVVSLKMAPGEKEDDAVELAREAIERQARSASRVPEPTRRSLFSNDDAGTGRMGMTVEQCCAKYGDAVNSTIDVKVFHVDDFSVGIFFSDGHARAFMYSKASNLFGSEPLKNAEIEKLLSMFSGGQYWKQVDLNAIAWNEKTGPRQADAMRRSVREYQWDRSDGRLSAFYDRIKDSLTVLDSKYASRKDGDPSTTIEHL